MPVYRYQLTGVNIDRLKGQVPVADAPSIVAGSIASTVVWDVTAPATSKADIDNYMADIGWTYTSTDPATTPAQDFLAQPGLAAQEDEYVATVGQVTFILSQTPTDPVSVTVAVNGVIYDDISDYTVSGTTLTWLNTLFSLDTGDKVIVRYS
jgi:hypothetical protein